MDLRDTSAIGIQRTNNGDEFVGVGYGKDSVSTSVLPVINHWIDEWCRVASSIAPIVQTENDMECVRDILNTYNTLNAECYLDYHILSTQNIG